MSGEECPRRGKLFGGCKFEGRYDVIPGPPPARFKGDAEQFEAVARALTKRVYVGDVCVRCGKTVPRSEVER